MNQHSPLRSASLIERAAELYGFGAPTPAPAAAPRREPPPRPEPEVRAEPRPEPRPLPRPAPAPSQRLARIDRIRLAEAGLIEPDAPVGALAEEFRIVKRQLLLNARSATDLPDSKRRAILLCSAQPDEGKTFCALNLALSLAGERDTEVLLVDADFPKPEIPALLGIEEGRGLVDALADPSLDPEALVVATDLRGLSVLPAGRRVDNVTELLASERTREVLARLAANPKRIILFDSPPALAASPASVLAAHAGQLLMVVRADQTTESELREAIELLSACERVSLVLNGAGLAAGGRRFGAYYGYGT
jgi:exopolysaccharide/PEP-CTERM locus tyrosine autokinase